MLQAVSIKNYLSFKEQKRLQVRDGKLVVVGEGNENKEKIYSNNYCIFIHYYKCLQRDSCENNFRNSRSALIN
jgi:hypothetical protein